MKDQQPLVFVVVFYNNKIINESLLSIVADLSVLDGFIIN